MQTPYPEEEQPSSSLSTTDLPENEHFHDDMAEKSSGELSDQADLDALLTHNDLDAPSTHNDFDDLDKPSNLDVFDEFEDGEVFYYDLEDMEEPEGIQGSERFYDAMDLECMEDLQDYLVDLERIFLDSRFQPQLQDLIRQIQLPPALLSSYPAIQAFVFFLEKISCYYWIPSSLFKTYLESPHDSSHAIDTDWNTPVAPAREDVQEYLPVKTISFDEFPPLGDLLIVEQILPPPSPLLPPPRPSRPQAASRWKNNLLAAQANLKRDLSIYQAQVEQVLAIFDPTIILLHSEFAHATLEEEIKNLEALYEESAINPSSYESTIANGATDLGSPTADVSHPRANFSYLYSSKADGQASTWVRQRLSSFMKGWWPQKNKGHDESSSLAESSQPGDEALDDLPQDEQSDIASEEQANMQADGQASANRNLQQPYPGQDQAEERESVQITDEEFSCLSYWCRVLLPKTPSRKEMNQLKDNYFRPSGSLAAKSFDDKRKEYQSAYQMLTVHMTEHYQPRTGTAAEVEKDPITKEELARLIADHGESDLLSFLKSRLAVLNNLVTTMNQMAYGTKRDELYGDIFSTVWKGVETNPDILRMAVLETVDICNSCEELAYFLIAPGASLQAFARSTKNEGRQLPQLPPETKERADALCRRLLEAVPHLLLARQVQERWTLPAEVLAHAIKLNACNVKMSQIFWDKLCRSFLSPADSGPDAQPIWEENTSFPYAYQEFTKNTTNPLLLRLRNSHDTLFQVFPDKHKLWASQVNLPLDLGKYSLTPTAQPRNHQLTFLDHYGKAVILTHLAIMLIQKNPPVFSEYLSDLEQQYFKERDFAPFEDVPLDDPDFLFMLNREKTEMRPGHRLALAQFFKLAGKGAKGVFEEAFAATIQRTLEWLERNQSGLAILSKNPQLLAELFARVQADDLEASSAQDELDDFESASAQEEDDKDNTAPNPDEAKVKALQTYWEAKSFLLFLLKQTQQEEESAPKTPISKVVKPMTKAPILPYMSYVPEFWPAPYYPFSGIDLLWSAEDLAYLQKEYPAWLSQAFIKEQKTLLRARQQRDGLDRKEDGAKVDQAFQASMVKKPPLPPNYNPKSITSVLGPLASCLDEANSLYESSQLTLNRYIYNYIDNPPSGKDTLSPDDLTLFFPFQPQEEAKRIRQGLETYTMAFSRMVKALHFDYAKIRERQPDLLPLPHYEFYQLMNLSKTRFEIAITCLEELHAQEPDLNDVCWMKLIQRYLALEISKTYELISHASFYTKHIYHILSYSIDAFTAYRPPTLPSMDGTDSPQANLQAFRWHPTQESKEIREALISTLTETGETVEASSKAPQHLFISLDDEQILLAQALQERKIFLTEVYPKRSAELFALLRLILKQLNLTDFWFSNTEYKLDQSVMDRAKADAAVRHETSSIPASEMDTPEGGGFEQGTFFEDQCQLSQEELRKDIRETLSLIMEDQIPQRGLAEQIAESKQAAAESTDVGIRELSQEQSGDPDQALRQIQDLLQVTEKDLKIIQKNNGKKATLPGDHPLSLLAYLYREYFDKKAVRIPYETWTWEKSQVLQGWQPESLSNQDLQAAFQGEIFPQVLTELLTTEAPIYETYMRTVLQQELQAYWKVKKLDWTQQRACLSFIDKMSIAELLADRPYVAISERPQEFLAWTLARQIKLSQAKWTVICQEIEANREPSQAGNTKADSAETGNARSENAKSRNAKTRKGKAAKLVRAAKVKVLILPFEIDLAKLSSFRVPEASPPSVQKTGGSARKRGTRKPDNIPKMEYLQAMLYYTDSVLMEKMGNKPQKWPSLEEFFTNQLLKTDTLRPVVKDFRIKGLANSKQNAKDCQDFIKVWELLREKYVPELVDESGKDATQVGAESGKDADKAENSLDAASDL